MKKIKFYPFSEATAIFAPVPVPAGKMLPDWYRKKPGTHDLDSGLINGYATSTIKRCMPIFDAISSGYLILAPCDIYIDATNPDRITYSIPAELTEFKSDMFATHGKEQYDGYPINTNKYHSDLLRILPFWSVKTPKGTSSMVMQPLHHEKSPLFAFAGIIDTDKFISDGHFSFLVEKDFKGVIKQGTPLVQVVPFKREAWTMSIVKPEISKKELNTQRLTLRASFVNGYKNKFRSKKDYH